MDAPYTHRDFVRPEGPLATTDGALDGPNALLVKRSNCFSLHQFSRSPMDVVGWDGFVYPFAFAIEKLDAPPVPLPKTR